MTSPIDFEPAAQRMARLVEAVPDDALGLPTPCRDYTVGDLLDHIGGGAVAFRAAALKKPIGPAPPGDAASLGDDWRTRIPHDLRALPEAWRDPDAWTGMTELGGVDLPGEIAGAVVLDELVVHGWDVAKAIGQPTGYDGPGLDVVLNTVQQFRAGGIEGIFGAEVAVPDDAPILDRILGVTGRDPEWKGVT